MDKNKRAPWTSGQRLRVLVHNEEWPDIDYMPVMPMGGYNISEIPNGEWVTFLSEQMFGDAIMYRVQYHEAEVFVPESMLVYLKFVRERPKKSLRYR